LAVGFGRAVEVGQSPNDHGPFKSPLQKSSRELEGTLIEYPYKSQRRLYALVQPNPGRPEVRLYALVQPNSLASSLLGRGAGFAITSRSFDTRCV